MPSSTYDDYIEISHIGAKCTGALKIGGRRASDYFEHREFDLGALPEVPSGTPPGLPDDPKYPSKGVPVRLGSMGGSAAG